MNALKPGRKFPRFAVLVFTVMTLLPAEKVWADDSMNHEVMNSASLATVLMNGLFTGPLDSASVAAWKTLITILQQKGETLHTKRVAWISLFHPLYTGRRVGAMVLIDLADLTDPEEVSALLAIDNDCLRSTFVDLAENGYFVKYAIAPQLAELLEDENYLRRNRQGRLVRILRALYHYSDKSVASQVAQYLDDQSKTVRENSARTLGKITGHAFSRKGDMDFTPSAYYLMKAKMWWFMDKDRSEYKPSEKRLIKRYVDPEPKKQTQEDELRIRITQLQEKDFIVWAKAFDELLAFGLEHEPAPVKALLEHTSLSETDAVYMEVLMKLYDFYNGKRKTSSEIEFKKRYDIREFCY